MLAREDESDLAAGEYLLVMTNLPDRASAEALARNLVEQRLAACVSVLAPCRSHFRWQGALEAADEVPLLIKTRRERYDALAAAIRGSHPYQLPEVIALPIVQGLPAYLAWVAAETRPVDET